MNAAGRVFAERGYSDTTSKEICELAGTNAAAVNYYFGNRDNLYQEVLIEAHKQLISMEDLTGIMQTPLPPEEKLTRLLTLLLRTGMSSSRLWGVRVCLREIVAPTSFASGMVSSAVVPKSRVIGQLVSDIIGYPPGSPQVQRALVFVILPCIALILVPDHLRIQALPASGMDSASFREEMLVYVLSGLQALKKKD